MGKRLNGWQIVSSPMAERYDTVGIKRGVDELAGQVGHRKKKTKKKTNQCFPTVMIPSY